MGVVGVTQRQRVLLEALRRAARPATILELAEATGRHPTTVREHLGELADAGLVRSAPLREGARGRPRLVWFAVRTAESSLADMAVVLGGALATTEDDPPGVAYELGRRLADRATEQVADLSLEMTRLGFDSRPDDDDPRTLWLHACPYLRAAEVVPEVACSMHEGLADALIEDSVELAGLRARVDPHVRPGVCRIRLVPRTED